ncbi:MAG: TauD/TfdA family dioxygenase [Halioglobus sp.]
MNATSTPWELRKLSGSLGAEITGLKLVDANESEIEQIKKLLVEHMVLFFPAQSPSVEEHVEFGRNFGKLEGHPNLTENSELPPEIFELKASSGGIADEWHTDLTFQENPALMSILHMVTCPDNGGDTMWTNLCAAYDELSDPMKSLCNGLTALHDAHAHDHAEQTAIHPVVRVHPETGRKALYVNEHFTRRIVEMNATESDALLPMLTRWVANPRFTVRYHWSPGTIAMWDNRATQHFVLNDFVGERIIQRVTVMGDDVHAAQPSSWQPWFLQDGTISATSRHDRQLYQHFKAREMRAK